MACAGVGAKRYDTVSRRRISNSMVHFMQEHIRTRRTKASNRQPGGAV